MKQISSITNDPRQRHRVLLPDSTVVDILMEYKKNQQGWFCSIAYEGLSFLNRRLVLSPNMLRQFKNLIPFGLACNTSDGYEPNFQDDFSNGRAQLYLLNSDDVAQVESDIING